MRISAVERLSIRAISRQLGHSRKAIRKVLDHAEPEGYQRKKTHAAPKIGPYRSRIEELIKESEQMPRKQRYTAHKIYQLLQMEGYRGSESNLHHYVSLQRRARKHRPAYLPLELDIGQDAQVDWGEAQAEINGARQTMQMFVMRLNYSKARFVVAFPFQKQEAFFEGHILAFHFFGGVPRRITYDNLKTAVFRVMEDTIAWSKGISVPFAVITCSRATTARPRKDMRKAVSKATWAMPSETFLRRSRKPKILRN